MIFKKALSVPLNILVMALMVGFSSCFLNPDVKKKNIPAGLSSTVSGVITEEGSLRHMGNVKVYVEEYVDNAKNDLTFSSNIDSTLSDAQGKYVLTFKTTGAGAQYRVGFLPAGNYLLSSTTLSKIIDPGKQTTINVSFMKLVAVITTLHIDTIPNPPLSGYTNFGFHSLLVHQRNPLDTTALFLMQANAINKLFFDFVNPDTSTIHNSQTDTVNLIHYFSDSARREFTIHPAEFKGRD